MPVLIRGEMLVDVYQKETWRVRNPMNRDFYAPDTGYLISFLSHLLSSDIVSVAETKGYLKLFLTAQQQACFSGWRYCPIFQLSEKSLLREKKKMKYARQHF